jgi:C4-dicarboxylate transporter, DctM subunit
MIYSCIPLGSYLMCFRFLQATWNFIRTGFNPHDLHDPLADHEHAPEIGETNAVMQQTKTATASYISKFSAVLVIGIPVLLTLVCIANRLEIIHLSQTVRAELLFALLLALMASGMPISIALGLSVLTYLFILSSVDPKMVGLKLFTSIDRFEIMAIPFFILAGNFLTSGGVAKRMIAFATSLIGHWYGGLGLAGVVACALFAAISGSSVATVVGIGTIILPALVE